MLFSDKMFTYNLLQFSRKDSKYEKSKTNFSNHRRDCSGWALYFYYRLCSFCQRKFYEHAHDIYLCFCDHPCFDLGIQFYLQTDQKRFQRKRYCRALKNQHLNKIFCQVLILLLSYLFFCVLRYSFCVLNSLRAFCIFRDGQFLNRF